MEVCITRKLIYFPLPCLITRGYSSFSPENILKPQFIVETPIKFLLIFGFSQLETSLFRVDLLCICRGRRVGRLGRIFLLLSIFGALLGSQSRAVGHVLSNSMFSTPMTGNGKHTTYKHCDFCEDHQ